MSTYAISRRQDVFDFLTILLDILSPLFAFLTEEREARQPVAPVTTAPPVPIPVPTEPAEPDDDDRTVEIEVPVVTREEAEAVVADEPEADEPTIVGPLFVRKGEGKGARYVFATPVVDGPRYRRRFVGKRAVYESV
jgi:hypothetical protein